MAVIECWRRVMLMMIVRLGAGFVAAVCLWVWEKVKEVQVWGRVVSAL
jgi:hypothetical protein